MIQRQINNELYKYIINEGIWQELTSLASKESVHPQLQKIVDGATKINTILTYASDDSIKWWNTLLDYYSIPEAERKEFMVAIIDSVKKNVNIPKKPDPTTHKQSLLHFIANSKLKQSRKKQLISLISNMTFKESINEDLKDYMQSLNDKLSKMSTANINKQIAIAAIKAMESAILNAAKTAENTKDHARAAVLYARLGKKYEYVDKTAESKKKAQETAQELWKLINLRAIGKINVSNDELRKYLYKINKLGYKIIWQGRKTKSYPNGDQEPKIE